MTTRQRNIAFLLVVGAIAAVGAFFVPSKGATPRAFDAVPEGAFLAITIDLAKLRSSDLPSELGFGRRSGLDDVTAQCGMDPLDRATDAAIAVPEVGEPGDFGIAVVVDMRPEELVQCATKVLAARGGNAAVHEQNGYTIIEDTTLGAARPRVAVRLGAPVLIGHGDWLDAMMRAFDRKAPRASAPGSTHARLREALHADTKAIAATAILPVSLRHKLRDDVLDGQKPGGVTFDAVLAVSEVAVGIRLGSDAGRDGVDAIASCETPEACVTLHAFLDKKRTALSSDFGVRLIGLGALLDRTTVETRGRELILTLDAPADEVVRVFNRAVLAGGDDFPSAPPNRVDASAAPIKPDLVIPARAGDR